MKVLPISTTALSMQSLKNVQNTAKAVSFSAQESKKSEFKTIAGEKGQVLNYKDENGLFEIENISDGKVGTKFLLHPTDPKYKDLTILFTPESQLSSNDGSVKMAITEPLSFKGSQRRSLARTIRTRAASNDSLTASAYFRDSTVAKFAVHRRMPLVKRSRQIWSEVPGVI